MLAVSDETMVDGAEEWAFFQAYWPHGMPPPPAGAAALASAPPSEPSTGVPESEPERQAKQARTQDSKGPDGRGGGNGKGGKAAGTKRPQGGGAPSQAASSHWQRGSGSSWNQRGGWKDESWGNHGHSERDLRHVLYVLEMMQRLILRHEDSINLLRLESSFVMHMRLNVPSSVCSMLYAAASSWRNIKQAEPSKLDRPMRAALLYCLFMELKTRLEAVAGKAEDLDRMEKLGWLAKGPPITWSYLTWDAASKKQIIDTSKVPLSQNEILEHVSTVIRLCPRQHAVARFHPTRPMAEEMKGDSLVFLLQTGQHGDGCAEMRDSLAVLCHSSVMNLVAMQAQGRSLCQVQVGQCDCGVPLELWCTVIMPGRSRF